jgi:predicted nucleic acid-binding protein
MTYLLDPHVLSERTRGSPHAGAEGLLRRVPAEETVRVSALALAGIAQGVENNPTAGLKTLLAEVLQLPVAAFGEDEALEWGRMTSGGLARGLHLAVRDTVGEATAAAHGWIVATRNTKDFAPLGVKTFNPWKERL